MVEIENKIYKERPVENFDDFLDRHKIIGDDDKWFDFKDIEYIEIFNFDYLKTFKLNFNS